MQTGEKIGDPAIRSPRCLFAAVCFWPFRLLNERHGKPFCDGASHQHDRKWFPHPAHRTLHWNSRLGQFPSGSRLSDRAGACPCRRVDSTRSSGEASACTVFRLRGLSIRLTGRTLFRFFFFRDVLFIEIAFGPAQQTSKRSAADALESFFRIGIFFGLSIGQQQTPPVSSRSVKCPESETRNQRTSLRFREKNMENTVASSAPRRPQLLVKLIDPNWPRLATRMENGWVTFVSVTCWRPLVIIQNAARKPKPTIMRSGYFFLAQRQDPVQAIAHEKNVAGHRRSCRPAAEALPAKSCRPGLRKTEPSYRSPTRR